MLNWWDEGEEHLRGAGYDHARFMRELKPTTRLREAGIGRDMAERFATSPSSTTAPPIARVEPAQR